MPIDDGPKSEQIAEKILEWFADRYAVWVLLGSTVAALLILTILAALVLLAVNTIGGLI